jgi:hypothetical protein
MEYEISNKNKMLHSGCFPTIPSVRKLSGMKQKG